MDAVITEDDVRHMIERRIETPLFPFEPIGASSNYLQPAFEKKITSTFRNGYRMSNGQFYKLDEDLPWNHPDRTVSYNLQAFKPLSSMLLGHSAYKRQDCFDLIEKYVDGWLSVVRPPSETELAGNWTNDGQNNDFLWYDMAVGMRAYRLAYIIDVMLRAATPDIPKLVRLIQVLDWHRQILIREETFSSHNNHGLYQACGQIVMARRFTDVPGMAEALSQGLSRFDAMMAQQFFHEGVHREHSPGYHWMILGTLGEAMRSGLLTKDEHILHLNRIEDSMAWFILPNMQIAAFGDTDAGGIGADTVPSDFTHPHLRYVLSRGTIGLPPASPVKFFEESGYAVLRIPESKTLPYPCYLAQHAGFHSMTHKHADHLSIIWHDKGQDILVDAGRYAYLGKTEAGSELWKQGFWYSDPKRVYCEGTSSHNTIEIDGKHYPRRNVEPYGNALGRYAHTENGVHAIESECKHFNTITHARVLFVKPGHFLIVYDWLRDSSKKELHDYRQWFHLGKALEATPDGNRIAVSLNGEAFMDICPLIEGARLEQCVKGQEEPVLQGWVSHDRDVILDPNWAFAYLNAQVNQGAMATLFSLHPGVTVDAGTKILPSGRGGHIIWTDGAGRHKLHFTRPAEGNMTLDYEMTPAQAS